VVWILPAPNAGQLWDIMRMVINLGVSQEFGNFLSSWVNVSFLRSLSHGVLCCLLIAVCKNVRPTLSRRTGSGCEERRPYLRCCILISLNFIFPTLFPWRYMKLDNSCDILSSHSAAQFTAQYQIKGWWQLCYRTVRSETSAITV
jgi:hypothetical protein